MKLMRLLSGLSLLCIASALAQTQTGPGKMLYGKNMIQNPGAEMEAVNFVTPYWGHQDTVSTYGYATTAGEFDGDWNKPASLGNHYFRFGAESRSTVFQSRSQYADLSALKDSIRIGHVGYTLSGYFGTFHSQDFGAVTLHAIFLDVSGKELLHVKTENVKPDEIKGNDWDMIKKSAGGTVPAQAVKVKFYMTGTGFIFEAGQTNQAWAAFADDLNFFLSMIKGE